VPALIRSGGLRPMLIPEARAMPRRYHFADAFWFRRPLKALVVVVFVFACLSLYPALTNGTSQDHERALFGLTVLGGFVISAVLIWVAMDDSYVEIEDGHLSIRFEAFFRMEIALADIVRIAPIDPRPRWRYRFGLSTNFEDRIACSHGGQMIEIELASPAPARIWPRSIAVRRLWLAVREYEAFLADLRSAAPRAFAADSPRLAA
jgi:hypothetical protein